MGLPEFFAFDVLAGLLVGEDPDAARLGQRGDLPVQKLVLRGDPRVPDQRSGQDGRFGGERVFGDLAEVGSAERVLRGGRHAEKCR